MVRCGEAIYGRPMSHPDVASGRETRADPSPGTALACEDWQAFAGPGVRWRRSIARMEAEGESRITKAVAEVMRGETFSHVSPGWLRFLQRNLPVAAFAFNECGHILKDISGRSPWGGMSDGLALQASMQFRQAQSLVLYAADMEQRLGAMPMQVARNRWCSDRHWLPAHHFLEQAATCPDWGEALVAVNLCFEPLIGQLLRRELAMKSGPAHGDRVTALVAATGQEEWALTRTWTVAALTFLLADPSHSEANRELVQGWIARQLPVAEAATRDLGGLAEQLPTPMPEGRAVACVIDDQRALLADIGLAAA
jgi:propane monooxygenase small subunit